MILRIFTMNKKKLSTNKEEFYGKREIIDGISVELDTTKIISKDILKGVINVFLNLLKKNAVLRIPGLGSFRIQKVSRRAGRNPRTGEEVTIDETKRISFRASKEFKRIINGEK
jgi:DNA-binding protein HU-beta